MKLTHVANWGTAKHKTGKSVCGDIRRTLLFLGLLASVCFADGCNQAPIASDKDEDKGGSKELVFDGPQVDGKAIRDLIPIAASMSFDKFEDLANSGSAPEESDVDNKSLTLQILVIYLTAKDTDQQLAEFRSLSGSSPAPAQMAREFVRPVEGASERVATAIHADRITKFDCHVHRDSALGNFEFEVPGVYAGRVNFEAKRNKKQWSVTKFHMPAREIEISLSPDGMWIRNTESSD